MISLLLFAVSLAQANGQPINVPIQTPSGWVRTFSDPIWGGTAVFQGPDGSWTIFVQKSTMSNELSAKPSDLQQPGVGGDTGVYMMKFSVANKLTVYPGYYEAAITLGHIDPITHSVVGHELCSIDGWATQLITEIPLMCPSPDYILGDWPDGSGKADPNAHIIISLSHVKGWPLLFDKVSLTFTPSN